MQVYEIMFKKVIDLIDKGHLIWQQGWIDDQINYYRKRKYTGFNAFYLNAIAQSKGYKLPYWLTFKEVGKLGGSIKKGAKSTMVMLYKPIFHCRDCEHDQNVGCELNKNKKDKSYNCVQYKGITHFTMRYYNVWNTDQISGISFNTNDLYENSSLNPTQSTEAENVALNYIYNEGINFKTGGTRASYTPSTDMIKVPEKEVFNSMDRYYSVLFHEICHSTGHSERLARKIVKNNNIVFGNEDYSMEELVAEMGSLFLCSKTGIKKENNIENSAAYIAGWKKYLASNKKAIFIAANLAEKAADFVLYKAEVKNAA